MNRILVWDLPTRVGHWSLVVSFIVAWLSGDGEQWRMVHVVAGCAMLGILMFRILWGLIGSRYARFSSFLFSPGQALDYFKQLTQGQDVRWTGHNPAGSYAIYALILLGLLNVLSGWLAYIGIGPEEVEEVHEILTEAMLTFVLLHVLGEVASSLLHRENLILSMVTGYKAGNPADAITNMKAKWLFLLFACIMAAMWLGSK